jgi:hypothetical protein
MEQTALPAFKDVVRKEIATLRDYFFLPPTSRARIVGRMHVLCVHKIASSQRSAKGFS